MNIKSFRSIIKYLLPRNLHPIRFQLAFLARESKKRKAIIGEYATAILTEGFNGKILISALDTGVGKDLAYSGAYNKPEIEFHLSYLTTKSKVLIVGAHVGSLLIPIAKKVERVIGIEANPNTYSLLEINILLNNLANVQLHHLAAGDKNALVEFMMQTQNSGGSKVKHGDFNENDPILGYDNPELVKVPMDRLDDCIELLEFDLIIMDIEGAEFLALNGMTKILAKAKRLQIELVPFLLEQSHITSLQILALLKPHFDKIWFLQSALEGEPSCSLEEFSKKLEINNQLIDIYLEKEGVR